MPVTWPLNPRKRQLITYTNFSSSWLDPPGLLPRKFNKVIHVSTITASLFVLEYSFYYNDSLFEVNLRHHYLGLPNSYHEFLAEELFLGKQHKVAFSLHSLHCIVEFTPKSVWTFDFMVGFFILWPQSWTRVLTVILMLIMLNCRRKKVSLSLVRNYQQTYKF